MTAAVVYSWLSPTEAEKGNRNRCALASVRHSLPDSRFSHNCSRCTVHRFEHDQALCVFNCQGTDIRNHRPRSYDDGRFGVLWPLIR